MILANKNTRADAGGLGRPHRSVGRIGTGMKKLSDQQLRDLRMLLG
jgi:hypothetical protein